MATKRKTKRARWREGDFVAIPLSDGMQSYGRLLRFPLVAFYNLQTKDAVATSVIAAADVAFTILVMKYAVTDGDWKIIGNAPPEPRLLEERLFFIKDSISGKYSLYKSSTGEEFPATSEQCSHLECAAVWEPEHVQSRLIDHFAGRPNEWVELMRK